VLIYPAAIAADLDCYLRLQALISMCNDLIGLVML